MLQQILIPQQVFLAIQLAIELALFNSFSQAAMMYEVSTAQLPQESLLFIRACDALQFLNLYVQLFAFNDVPPYVFAEKARQGGCQKVGQPPGIFKLYAYVAHLGIHLFLHLAVLTLPPFLLSPILAYKRVLDVLPKFEAVIAKRDIFAIDALIDSLVRVYLAQFAAITVVVVLLAADLFGNLLFLDLVLFLLDFSHNFWRFLVPAKGALDDPVVFDLVLGPLHEALQMEGVPANSGARGGGVALNYLHVANRAQIIVLLVLFLDDDIAPGHLDFDVFEEIGDLVFMDPSVGDDVAEFLVIVGVPEKEGVVVGQVEDVGEDVEGVQTLVVIVGGAGALEFVADGDLELGAVDVLEDEAGAAGYADEVELLHVGEFVLDLLGLQQVVLLAVRLRHHQLILFATCSSIFYSSFIYAVLIKSLSYHFFALLCWARSKFISDSRFSFARRWVPSAFFDSFSARLVSFREPAFRNSITRFSQEETPPTSPMTCLMSLTRFPRAPLRWAGRTVLVLGLYLVTGWPLFLPMAMTAGCALAIRLDYIRINLLILIQLVCYKLETEGVGLGSRGNQVSDFVFESVFVLILQVSFQERLAFSSSRDLLFSMQMFYSFSQTHKEEGKCRVA